MNNNNLNKDNFEYYSNNYYTEFLNSIKRFEISEEDYNSFVYDEDYKPKNWLYINNKEENIIKDYTLDLFDSNINPYYVIYRKYIIKNDIFFQVHLIKLPDDYYYIEVMMDNNESFYRIDQLSELRYVIKQLNIKRN